MTLNDVLDPRCVRTGSDARDKNEILEEIAELAVNNEALAEFGAERIRDELSRREETGTTGFQYGVAIPHCSFPELDRFVVGAITAPDGVEFDAIDGNPSRLFFFIVGPQNRRNLHVQLLAAISKIIKVPNAVDALLACSSPDELRRSILEHIQFQEGGEQGQPSALVHVYVQREELFEDILELFSAVTSGSVAVMELNNAGHYLHRIPLFASLWSEETRKAIRHIQAIVPRSQTNDIVRKIHLIEDGIFERSGVLVAVQDLSYTTGSIDF